MVPDLAFVVPATLAPYADSTLGFDGEEEVVEEERPPRGRRAIVGAAVAAVLIAGLAFYLLADNNAAVASVGTTASTGDSVGSAAVTTDTAAATPVSPVAPGEKTPTVPVDPNAPVPATPVVPAGLLEGVDYSYGSRTADGSIVRWDCTTPITVRLAGTAPAGSEQAIAEAVDQLKSKTNLPLQLGEALPNSVVDSAQVPTNEIVVNYLTSQQIADAGLDITGDRIGLGGPIYDDVSGRIQSGWVGIAVDDAATNPTSVTGRSTLWHEGAHALNLGHSAQQTAVPEVMAPETSSSDELAWGPGDSFALASVGCTAPLQTN